MSSLLRFSLTVFCVAFIVRGAACQCDYYAYTDNLGLRDRTISYKVCPGDTFKMAAWSNCNDRYLRFEDTVCIYAASQDRQQIVQAQRKEAPPYFGYYSHFPFSVEDAGKTFDIFEVNKRLSNVAIYNVVEVLTRAEFEGRGFGCAGNQAENAIFLGEIYCASVERNQEAASRVVEIRLQRQGFPELTANEGFTHQRASTGEELFTNVIFDADPAPGLWDIVLVLDNNEEVVAPEAFQVVPAAQSLQIRSSLQFVSEDIFLTYKENCWESNGRMSVYLRSVCKPVYETRFDGSMIVSEILLADARIYADGRLLESGFSFTNEYLGWTGRYTHNIGLDFEIAELLEPGNYQLELEWKDGHIETQTFEIKTVHFYPEFHVSDVVYGCPGGFTGRTVFPYICDGRSLGQMGGTGYLKNPRISNGRDTLACTYGPYETEGHEKLIIYPTLTRAQYDQEWVLLIDYPVNFMNPEGPYSEEMDTMRMEIDFIPICDKPNDTCLENPIEAKIEAAWDVETQTGSIEINPEGGEPPYAYSISGCGAWQDQNRFDNLQEGEYALFVRDDRYCMIDAVAKVDSVADPDNSLRASESVVVYPNPSSGELNVAFRAKSASQGVLIARDLAGRVALQQSVNWREGENTVKVRGVSELSPGVYLLLVRADGIETTRKFSVK